MWSFNSLEDALKGLPLVQGVFSQFQAPHVGGNTNPYAASIQAEEDETIRDALVSFLSQPQEVKHHFEAKQDSLQPMCAKAYPIYEGYRRQVTYKSNDAVHGRRKA